MGQRLRGEAVLKTPFSINSWAQCHTPVIPIMQKAEIGRMRVPRLWQKSSQNPTSTKKGRAQLHNICHPSYSGKSTIG
jgi:hypothetical protein